jgi:hypothetical protein
VLAGLALVDVGLDLAWLAAEGALDLIHFDAPGKLPAVR